MNNQILTQQGRENAARESLTSCEMIYGTRPVIEPIDAKTKASLLRRVVYAATLIEAGLQAAA